MFTTSFLRGLRDAKKWSQADVAAATKINQPRVSLYERSERQPSSLHYQRLERALALGEARDGEKEPMFALAVRGNQGRILLALASGPRVGLYQDSRLALQATRIMRRIHPGSAGRIGVVPVWLDAAFGVVLAARACQATPDAVYVVDRDRDPEKLVQGVTDHALQSADWFDGMRRTPSDADGAALADEFLRLRA